MKLFEAINHRPIGESYFRRYVWTTDLDRARQLIRACGGMWAEDRVEICELFDGSEDEFVTDESDVEFYRTAPDSR